MDEKSILYYERQLMLPTTSNIIEMHKLLSLTPLYNVNNLYSLLFLTCVNHRFSAILQLHTASSSPNQLSCTNLTFHKEPTTSCMEETRQKGMTWRDRDLNTDLWDTSSAQQQLNHGRGQLTVYRYYGHNDLFHLKTASLELPFISNQILIRSLDTPL